ncbi:MAG: Zn-dependent protease with chaperone function, partial [Verrucomicrobia bacterium]|nr:Zn-dependent protease with chaperone function [Verrucomicrobiota bacterium]
ASEPHPAESHEQIAGLAPSGTPPPRPSDTALATDNLLNQVGAPSPAQLEHTIELLASIPETVSTAVRDPYGARAVVIILLLSPDPAVRQRQLQQVATADEGVAALTHELLRASGQLTPRMRLPLVDLAIPVLRNLSPRQYETFRHTIRELVRADGEIDLFEYALQRVLLRHLDPHFAPVATRQTPVATAAELVDPASQLLSALAYFGHDQLSQAERAFAQGFVQLQTGTHRDLLPLQGIGLQTVDDALNRLAAASPTQSKRILAACVACVSADNKVTVEEAELLRAIADSLSCPIPPLLATS